jgi:hypothetical protein
MKIRSLLMLSCCLVSTGALAQVDAQGVALSAYSDCDSPAGLDITMSNGPVVTTETGLVTDDTGATLMSFSQGTGFANFSGTFVGYNFASPAWSVPPGTLVALYATIGVLPPTAADTGEFFILYQCDTREVLLECFGDYGTCPQTAAEALAGGPSLLEIPTLSPLGIALMVFVLASLGAFVLARRRVS